jgi:hypothetical protein
VKVFDKRDSEWVLNDTWKVLNSLSLILKGS